MEIFRFVLVRPAQQPAASLSLTLETKSSVQLKLSAAWDKGLLRPAGVPDAKTLFTDAADTKLIQSVDDVEIRKDLDAFLEEVNGILSETNVTTNRFRDAVEKVFKESPEELVRAERFTRTRASIFDTLVADKLFALGDADLMKSLSVYARVIHLINLVAFNGQGHPDLALDNFAAKLLITSLMLPKSFSSYEQSNDRRKSTATKRERQLLKENEDRLARLGIIKDENLSFAAAIEEIQKATPFDHALPDPASPDKEPVYLSLRAQFVSHKPALKKSFEILQLNPEAIPVTRLYQLLLDKIKKNNVEVNNLLESDGISRLRLVKVGNQWIEANALDTRPGSTDDITDVVRAAKPVGVADLITVRQRISRFEPGELAHIENVLGGEIRSRHHSRRDLSEVETLVETEMTKEEERDLQTTERNELKTEAERTVKEDSSLTAGVSLSASYGPVTLSTNLTSSSSTAVSDGLRQSTMFAKDVVSRAVSRTSERTLVRRTEKKVSEIIETNLHQFSNSDSDHIVGLYQWINKVYTAQMYNYGLRMLYEISIPEPGAFWKDALKNSKAEGQTIPKPEPIDFVPGDFTEDKYLEYVARYRLGTATPPPVPYVTLSQPFAKAGLADKNNASDSVILDVPDGYQCLSALIRSSGSFYTGAPTAAVDVIVGTTLTSSPWQKSSRTRI